MSWQNLNLPSSEQLNSELLTQKAVIPLSHLSSIEVSGGDAASFLHNLLTNDVQSLQDKQARLCGFCTPKGRLLATMIVIKEGTSFFLILPSSLADFIQKRLTMFILRSQVTIKQVETKPFIFALSGETKLDDDFLSQPLIDHPVLDLKLVFLTEQQAVSLVDWCKQNNTALSPFGLWDYAYIEQGLPQIYAESKEAFTPQQVNLDLVSGVSFKKGCYPGQEVVARLHYLGSPSRRLFKANFKSTVLPEINSEVMSEENEVLGHVVQAVQISEGEVLLQLTMKLADIHKQAYIDSIALSEVERYVEETD